MTCITCLGDCLGGRMIDSDLQGSPSWNEISRGVSQVWSLATLGELGSWSWVNIPMIYRVWYIPGGCFGISSINRILVPGKHITHHILPDHIFSIQFQNIVVLFFLKLELVPMMEYHIAILYFYPPCGDTCESLYKHWINHIFMTQIGWRTCVEHFLNSIARCSTAGALARQNPSNKNTASPCHPCWISDIGVQVLHVYTHIYVSIHSNTRIDLINEYHAGTWMASLMKWIITVCDIQPTKCAPDSFCLYFLHC